MRLPLSPYSMWVASRVHGFSPGASAARAWTPGSAMAAAVNAARRLLTTLFLIAPTAAPADARRCGAPLLPAVGTKLLGRFLRRIFGCHHRLGEGSSLPGFNRRAAGDPRQPQCGHACKRASRRKRHLPVRVESFLQLPPDFAAILVAKASVDGTHGAAPIDHERTRHAFEPIRRPAT